MRAMVLAAGLGTRMRPLTEHTPKPLIKVGGKALIDWSLDALVHAGVQKIIVNVSYLAEQVEAHIEARSDAEYIISYEPTLLETGGGIKQALPHLGDEPFIVMNSDAFFMHGANAIHKLQADESNAPICLMLHPKDTAIGYHGVGDFFCNEAGSIRRKSTEEGEAPFVFTGMQKLHPEIFHDAPEGAFSMNVLYNQSIAQDGTLEGVCGLVHEDTWLHVGTPEEKQLAETFIAKQR